MKFHFVPDVSIKHFTSNKNVFRSVLNHRIVSASRTSVKETDVIGSAETAQVRRNIGSNTKLSPQSGGATVLTWARERRPVEINGVVETNAHEMLVLCWNTSLDTFPFLFPSADMEDEDGTCLLDVLW